MTNKGELRWTLLDGAIKAPALIRFMQCLVRDAGRKVFLVLDPRKSLRDFADLPVHRARAVQDWLAGRRARPQTLQVSARSRCSTCPPIAPS